MNQGPQGIPGAQRNGSEGKVPVSVEQRLVPRNGPKANVLGQILHLFGQTEIGRGIQAVAQHQQLHTRRQGAEAGTPARPGEDEVGIGRLAEKQAHQPEAAFHQQARPRADAGLLAQEACIGKPHIRAGQIAGQAIRHPAQGPMGKQQGLGNPALDKPDSLVEGLPGTHDISLTNQGDQAPPQQQGGLSLHGQNLILGQQAIHLRSQTVQPVKITSRRQHGINHRRARQGGHIQLGRPPPRLIQRLQVPETRPPVPHGKQQTTAQQRQGPGTFLQTAERRPGGQIDSLHLEPLAHALHVQIPARRTNREI